jgi:hypothetical protein
MNNTRRLVLAAVLILISGDAASAQDISRYRAYALESSLDSIIAASGARPEAARIAHMRPARIDELEWRAPYVSPTVATADPVRSIAFSFYNDSLYQVIVNYDRYRTEGLTNTDVIESISEAYGVPVLATAKTRTTAPPEGSADSIVLARWDSADSQVTLLRGSYMPDYQLILISKSLSARARTAIRDAVKLDAHEAPGREADQRMKEAGAAAVALDKARATNKAAFRP